MFKSIFSLFVLPFFIGTTGITNPPVLFHDPCSITSETKIVSGNSLNGVFNDGTEVTALFGYYDCHSIERGDIVLYRYPGRQNLLIKIIHAIPGDSFTLQKTESGDLRIMVNGVIVTTSAGEPYMLTERKSRMLALYAKSYHNKIPSHAYLILGNLPGGSLDSTAFGLIDASSIIAKVAQ